MGRRGFCPLQEHTVLRCTQTGCLKLLNPSAPTSPGCPWTAGCPSRLFPSCSGQDSPPGEKLLLGVCMPQPSQLKRFSTQAPKRRVKEIKNTLENNVWYLSVPFPAPVPNTLPFTFCFNLLISPITELIPHGIF